MRLDFMETSMLLDFIWVNFIHLGKYWEAAYFIRLICGAVQLRRRKIVLIKSFIFQIGCLYLLSKVVDRDRALC